MSDTHQRYAAYIAIFCSIWIIIAMASAVVSGRCPAFLTDVIYRRTSPMRFSLMIGLYLAIAFANLALGVFYIWF